MVMLMVMVMVMVWYDDGLYGMMWWDGMVWYGMV